METDPYRRLTQRVHRKIRVGRDENASGSAVAGAMGADGNSARLLLRTNAWRWLLVQEVWSAGPSGGCSRVLVEVTTTRLAVETDRTGATGWHDRAARALPAKRHERDWRNRCRSASRRLQARRAARPAGRAAAAQRVAARPAARATRRVAPAAKRPRALAAPVAQRAVRAGDAGGSTSGQRVRAGRWCVRERAAMARKLG